MIRDESTMTKKLEDYYTHYAIEEGYPKEGQWGEIPKGFTREHDIEYGAKNFLLAIGREGDDLDGLSASYIWLKRSTGEVDKFCIWIDWDWDATIYRHRDEEEK